MKNYNNIRGAMTCFNCGSSILSKFHNIRCETVIMNQEKIQMFSNKDTIYPYKFKNMMTYGLCGCYAALLVGKNDSKYYFAYMIHHLILIYLLKN